MRAKFSCGAAACVRISQAATDSCVVYNFFRLRLEDSGSAVNALYMIDVKRSSGDEWLVTVKSAVTTQHRVRVPKTDAERLATGRSTEELVRESFCFLLEREPNTSILSSFNLSVIGRYFPEYEQEIQNRLKRK